MTNNVNPTMIVLARQSRGLTQTELASRLHCQQGTISKIEQGDLGVSNDMLEALSREDVVGTVAVITIDQHCWILKKMMVAPAFRGKDVGLSELLLQTAIDWSGENGMRKIYLGTMAQFTAAQKFYQKHGFRSISRQELPDGFAHNPIDTVFFVSEIG